MIILLLRLLYTAGCDLGQKGQESCIVSIEVLLMLEFVEGRPVDTEDKFFNDYSYMQR